MNQISMSDELMADCPQCKGEGIIFSQECCGKPTLHYEHTEFGIEPVSEICCGSPNDNQDLCVVCNASGKVPRSFLMAYRLNQAPSKKIEMDIDCDDIPF